jgi:ElaB/YqjD/DUF883 family membrane-anchored ribosome-binding protein
MERNANDNFGGQTSGESTSGGSYGAGSQGGSQGGSLGGSGSGYGGDTGAHTGTGSGSMGGSGTGGSDASFSREGSGGDSGLADRARNVASNAGEKLSDVGSQVRDRAGSLKNSLADVLESGAERLRSQGAGGGQIAGSSATGGVAGMIADDNRLAGASNQIAGGLQASADWLRDADLDGLKTGVERQVKEHPGRTLAVAVGLGYLLGKALRSK